MAELKKADQGITEVHPAYALYVKKWEQISDTLDDNVEKYLIDVVDPELVKQNPLRYNILTKRKKEYRERAVWTNVVERTINALIGTALTTSPNYKFPSQLDYLIKQAVGNNITFEQLIIRVIKNLLTLGRYAILTDFPKVDLKLDGQATRENNIHPINSCFSALDIDYWEPDAFGNIKLVKLRKLRTIKESRFKTKQEISYLVLSIEDDGYYYQAEYDKDENVLVEPFQVIAKGKPLKKIPIVFFGVKNNDSEIDKPPAYTLTKLNIAMYRNSASYEDNLNRHGQDTVTITSDLPKHEWEKYQKTYGPLLWGSGETYYLGTKGEIKLVQSQASPELANAMKDKLELMVMVGARLALPQAVNAPVETTRMWLGAETSQLNTAIINAQDGLDEVIANNAMFYGIESGWELKLYNEFIKEDPNPQLLAQLLAAITGGAIPKRILWDYFRKTKLISKEDTDEQLQLDLLKDDINNPTLQDQRPDAEFEDE